MFNQTWELATVQNFTCGRQCRAVVAAVCWCYRKTQYKSSLLIKDCLIIR